MVGVSSLHARKMALAAHLGPAELRDGYGALDVPLERLDVSQGIHLDYLLPFLGGLVSAITLHGHYASHNQRRTDQSGWDRPCNRSRLREYEEKRGGSNSHRAIRIRRRKT
jgi:hypothetical protein